MYNVCDRGQLLQANENCSFCDTSTGHATKHHIFGMKSLDGFEARCLSITASF